MLVCARFAGAHDRSIRQPGNRGKPPREEAVCDRPMALRPRLSAGLPLSEKPAHSAPVDALEGRECFAAGEEGKPREVNAQT
jgi:hypothetical protein